MQIFKDRYNNIPCLWKAVWRMPASLPLTVLTASIHGPIPVCSQSLLSLSPSPAPLFLTSSVSFVSSCSLPFNCEQSLLGLFLPLGIEIPLCGLHDLFRFTNQVAHNFEVLSLNWNTMGGDQVSPEACAQFSPVDFSAHFTCVRGSGQDQASSYVGSMWRAWSQWNLPRLLYLPHVLQRVSQELPLCCKA